MPYIQTPAQLREICQRRRPDIHLVEVEQIWCRACGATSSIVGLAHWPDCTGEDDDVRFRLRDRKPI